jgi:hypothetical protein
MNLMRNVVDATQQINSLTIPRVMGCCSAAIQFHFVSGVVVEGGFSRNVSSMGGCHPHLRGCEAILIDKHA